MAEKKFRKVQPCGMLYSFGREYFLLKSTPVEKDSWQNDGAYRWVVVPNKVVDTIPNFENLYSFARHIVSTAFTVEFSPDMPEINIWQLGDIDVTKTEWLPKQYDEPIPADVNELVKQALLEGAGLDYD